MLTSLRGHPPTTQRLPSTAPAPARPLSPPQPKPPEDELATRPHASPDLTVHQSQLLTTATPATPIGTQHLIAHYTIASTTEEEELEEHEPCDDYFPTNFRQHLTNPDTLSKIQDLVKRSSTDYDYHRHPTIATNKEDIPQVNLVRATTTDTNQATSTPADEIQHTIYETQDDHNHSEAHPLVKVKTHFHPSWRRCKTSIPYDLYQPPSTIPQHFTRYLEAYMTDNADLPTHANNDPAHRLNNPLSPPQLPTKPYSTPISNPFPTIVFPTSTIPNPTY
jgi:hypothetical protein